MEKMGWTRREVLKSGALATAAAALPGNLQAARTQPDTNKTGLLNPGGNNFPFRAITESLTHPYWYAEHDNPAASKQFWDRDFWDRVLTTSAEKFV